MDSTNRKIFWILFSVLSLGGYFLPFVWAIVEMFLALWLSWCASSTARSAVTTFDAVC